MGYGKEVYARVPFKYDSGRHLDRGEIFELQGRLNDQKLLGLKYCVELDDAEYKVNKRGIVKCPECGRQFVRSDFMYRHKRKPGGCLEPDRRGMTRLEFAQLAGVQDASKVDKRLFPELPTVEGSCVARGTT